MAHVTKPTSKAEPVAQPLIEARDLHVHFNSGRGLRRRRNTVRAVDGVSLSIARGETLGLVGESGSGKSTTGRALLMLRPPTSGSVVYDGVDMTSLDRGDLRALRRRVQLVFQNPYSSLNPRMSVRNILAEPMLAHDLGSRSHAARRAGELLEMVGLAATMGSRRPGEFSGGQRQRIAIARALAVDPEFVVLDEPVSALDVSVQAQILNLLLTLREQLKLTYLFIGHDLGVVRHLSHRVAVMYLGRVVEIGLVDDVYALPGHPYTRSLLSAVPIPDPVRERNRTRVILRGDQPSPLAPPSGCRFHTRCWLYERLDQPAVCREQDPPQVALSPAHAAACHFAEDASRTILDDAASAV
jgi:oligopeptide/dipeptide ABC transporter ATP-binding protein